MKKNTFIIGGVILVGTVIAFIFYKNRNKKKDDKITMEEGNNVEEIGNLIFSTPKTKLSTYSFVIVFGGISYANPKWMMGQTPKEILSKAVFVFAPYTMSYDSVLLKLNDFVTKNKLLIKDISILGFSAGGLNVQKSNIKSFKFVGLIDPSTRNEYTNLPFNNNVKMIYNDSNWGSLPKIKEVLPKLAQSVSKAGGDSEKVSLAHAKIPSYFFNKYKNSIV